MKVESLFSYCYWLRKATAVKSTEKWTTNIRNEVLCNYRLNQCKNNEESEI